MVYLDSIMGVNVNNNSIQHQAEYHKSRTSSGKTIVERAVPSYAERTRSLERSENRSQTYHQNEGLYLINKMNEFIIFLELQEVTVTLNLYVPVLLRPHLPRRSMYKNIQSR